MKKLKCLTIGWIAILFMTTSFLEGTNNEIAEAFETTTTLGTVSFALETDLFGALYVTDAPVEVINTPFAASISISSISPGAQVTSDDPNITGTLEFDCPVTTQGVESTEHMCSMILTIDDGSNTLLPPSELQMPLRVRYNRSAAANQLIETLEFGDIFNLNIGRTKGGGSGNWAM